MLAMIKGQCISGFVLKVISLNYVSYNQNRQLYGVMELISRNAKSNLPASEGSSDSDNDQHCQTAKKKNGEKQLVRIRRAKQTTQWINLGISMGLKLWSNIQYRVWAETMVGGRHTSSKRSLLQTI